MTFYKQDLKFTNSKSDNLLVYEGTEYVQSDYKAQERAMRVQAVKWMGNKAIGAVAARMKVIDTLLTNIRV